MTTHPWYNIYIYIHTVQNFRYRKSIRNSISEWLCMYSIKDESICKIGAILSHGPLLM
jgi:hypothetical protein